MNTTPEQIMDMSAALLTDVAQTQFTDAALLPYLNMAMDELQERFQLNNIPVTNEASSVITVLAGVTRIGFGSTPALPGDLVEIQRLHERTAGVIPWIPVRRMEFIPRVVEDQSISQFLYWSWVKQGINLIAATGDIDLKLDYISDIFNTPILIGDIAVPLNVINVKQFLGFQTAAFAAIAVENETRAGYLEGKADRAIQRELGIPIKGKQAITTRRQPFMGAYRRRGYV